MRTARNGHRKRLTTEELVMLISDKLNRDQFSDLIYRLDRDPEAIEAFDTIGRIRCPELYEDLERPDPEDAIGAEGDD